MSLSFFHLYWPLVINERGYGRSHLWRKRSHLQFTQRLGRICILQHRKLDSRFLSSSESKRKLLLHKALHHWQAILRWISIDLLPILLRDPSQYRIGFLARSPATPPVQICLKWPVGVDKVLIRRLQISFWKWVSNHNTWAYLIDTTNPIQGRNVLSSFSIKAGPGCSGL